MVKKHNKTTVSDVELEKLILDFRRVIESVVQQASLLATKLIAQLEVERKLTKTFPYDFTLDQLVEFVNLTYNGAFKTKSRNREVIEARHIAIYLAKENKYSYREIYEKTGSTHGNSISTCRKIEDFMVINDKNFLTSFKIFTDEFLKYLKKEEDAEEGKLDE